MFIEIKFIELIDFVKKGINNAVKRLSVSLSKKSHFLDFLDFFFSSFFQRGLIEGIMTAEVLSSLNRRGILYNSTKPAVPGRNLECSR